MVGRVEELKLVMDKRRRDGWGEMEVAKSAGKGQGNRRQKGKNGAAAESLEGINKSGSGASGQINHQGKSGAKPDPTYQLFSLRVEVKSKQVPSYPIIDRLVIGELEYWTLRLREQAML